MTTTRERTVIDRKVMSIQDFGDALVDTGDLDPVYVAIYGADLPHGQLCRLLISYWSFYHLGAAAWLSEHEGEEFWRQMRIAARNELPPPRIRDNGLVERWPRAAERRHFRGDKCVRAVHYLESRGTAEQLVGELIRPCGGPLTEKVIMDRIQEWPMFGPWIAFKAADMIERLGVARVQFSPDLGLMYAEPRAALDIMVKVNAFGTIRDHYDAVSHWLSKKPAPPGGDRACGPQEVETVMCKWKAHYNGHYHVGKDVKEVRHGLEGWGKTAEKLLHHAPPLVGV